MKTRENSQYISLIDSSPLPSKQPFILYISRGARDWPHRNLWNSIRPKGVPHEEKPTEQNIPEEPLEDFETPPEEIASVPVFDISHHPLKPISISKNPSLPTAA